MSTTGVPSIASIPRTRSTFPSIESSVTVCSETGLGRWASGSRRRRAPAGSPVPGMDLQAPPVGAVHPAEHDDFSAPAAERGIASRVAPAGDLPVETVQRGEVRRVDDDLRLLAGQRPLLRRVRRVFQDRPDEPDRPNDELLHPVFPSRSGFRGACLRSFC